VEALAKKRYFTNDAKKGVMMKDENRIGKDRRANRKTTVSDRTHIVAELIGSLNILPRYEVDSIFHATITLLFPHDTYKDAVLRDRKR